MRLAKQAKHDSVGFAYGDLYVQKAQEVNFAMLDFDKPPKQLKVVTSNSDMILNDAFKIQIMLCDYSACMLH